MSPALIGEKLDRFVWRCKQIFFGLKTENKTQITSRMEFSLLSNLLNDKKCILNRFLIPFYISTGSNKSYIALNYAHDDNQINLIELDFAFTTTKKVKSKLLGYY